MKKILSALFMLAVFAAQAQTNVLLDQAFWRGNPDVATVKAEIDKGSSPTELNRMSMDPIVMAITAQAPTETIKYLLAQKGIDPNRPTHDERTYLFWAANTGNTAVMEDLLQKGAKIDIEDSHGTTALTFAASAGQKNIAVYDLFIKYGADLKKITNHDGANLLLLAIAQDKDFTLTDYFISKGISLNSTDNAGNTAFNYAAKSGNINLMKSLIQKGVKFTDNALIMTSQAGGRGGGGFQGGGNQGRGNQEGEQGRGNQNNGFQGGNGGAGGNRGGGVNTLAVFQYLIDELKIKPTATNENGENALHLLAKKANQIPAINYLIEKGVDANQADNDGNTPFMAAASANRDTATVAMLLSHTKNINQVNKKGISALAMAVNSNSPAAVSYLISKGADIRVQDANGDNLAYYLIQSYNPKRGGFDDFDAKAKVLAEAGFNLTTPQKNGNTLYHLAISKNDLDLLKRLEGLKIDVNAKNKEGLTVLHKAAMTAKGDAILKYLLSIGAKKDIVTDFKETPYELASENEYLTKNNITVDFLK